MASPMGSDLLELREIGKSYFGVPVLRGVSLTVGRGRMLGLVGENGAGKSTLMNILGGVVQPDAGSMQFDGRAYLPRGPHSASRAGVAFIHQELNLFLNLSIAENLHVDAFPRQQVGGFSLPVVDQRLMASRTRELLARVELDHAPSTSVAELSPGHRQLVEIARAMGASARLLILDEPTTSLSSREVEHLFGLLRRLRQDGVSSIFISHHLEDVLELCNDVAILRDGVLISHGPRAGYDRRRLIMEMAGRIPDAMVVKRSDGTRGEPLLEVEGLSRRPMVREVGFTLHAGEILGVAGLMGAGRTEMARLLFGLDARDAGTIRLRGRTLVPSPRRSIQEGIAFLTESRREEGLMMDASVVENTALVALKSFARTPLGLIDDGALRAAVGERLSAVSFRAAGRSRQVARTLSGGNQQKIVLAKWLLRDPAVFILDEPTRGIDVVAKREVHAVIEALAARGSGVIMISSEIEELTAVSDRIMVMAAGRVQDVVPRHAFDRERILRAALGLGDGSENSP